jgi:hypothetical protein
MAGMRTEDAVVDCAEGRTSTALLDTSEVERAEAVEPLQEFLS